MKRQMAFGLAVAMVLATTAIDAQVGGLIRKKAGEIVGGKKPAPPEPVTPAPTSPDPAPATPAAPGTKSPAPAPGKAAVSPLETSELPLRQLAEPALRGQTPPLSSGDWEQLPFIPPAAVAAAYALSESSQAALVDTVGAALKTLVMSSAFVTQHDEFIKREYKAVNHGIQGVVSLEDALAKNDLKTLEALQKNLMVAMQVEIAETMPGDLLKHQLADELPRWKTYAANPQQRDRAKYQKMVTMAQSIESLPGTDEKFRRGWAVIKSIDSDGPDTEAAVYAVYARSIQEKEQAAYDRYNLKGQLRTHLTAFVSIASKVNFSAATVEKGGKTLFVNAADERRGAIWKACFRAGEAPTAAAIKLARDWLSEL